MTRQTQIWCTREGGVGTDDTSNLDLVLGSSSGELDLASQCEFRQPGLRHIVDKKSNSESWHQNTFLVKYVELVVYWPQEGSHGACSVARGASNSHGPAIKISRMSHI